MCYRCEERFADVGRIVDETIGLQTDYREMMTERSQAERVIDIANIWLQGVPFAPDTPTEMTVVVQHLALLLSAMTERLMEAQANV